MEYEAIHFKRRVKSQCTGIRLLLAFALASLQGNDLSIIEPQVLINELVSGSTIIPAEISYKWVCCCSLDLNMEVISAGMVELS